MTGRAARKDGYVLAALALGLAGLAFPAHPSPPPFRMVALLALAEEIVFRAGLQDWLESKLPWAIGPFTTANIAASAIFSLAHLFTQSAAHSLSVFFPSLVFGLLWSQKKSVLLCASVHCYYNMMYYYSTIS